MRRLVSQKDKPKTILCDLDGTIFKHQGDTVGIQRNQPVVLKGVVNKFNEWELNGHYIVLMTGRRESLRKRTEEHLQAFGIPYDLLLMGVSSGERVLINDKNILGEDTCFSVNVEKDEGFDSIEWDSLGL